MTTKKANDHWRLMYPSRYVCAAELGGKDVTVTIDKVDRAHEFETDRGIQKKPIVHFKDAKKPMMIGVTVAGQIAAATGCDSTADWAGKKITIYPTKVKAFGEMVDAIRVRVKR